MKNKKFWLCIKILCTAIILFILIHSSQLNINLFYTFFNNPILTFITILFCYLPTFLNTWRWYRLNYIQKIKLPFLHTITPTYLGFAFNNVLPGSVGGDFYRLYYLLKKFPEQKNGAILSIFFDRILGLMGMMLIICIFTPYYINLIHHNKTLMYIFSICAACSAGGLIAFITLLFILEKINITSWLKNKPYYPSWSTKLISFLNAIYIYRNSKLIILENIFISMTSQIWMLIIILLITKLMNFPFLSPLDYLIALIIGQIANLIPFTPGGIGIGEAAFANVMLALNPGTSSAYATVFLAWRLLMTIMYLPGVLMGIYKFNRNHLAFSHPGSHSSE